MKLKKVLRDKQGLGYPLVAAIVLVLLMLMMVGYEYMRLQIIGYGVRDAVQSAVNTVATANYETSFGGLKSGYSGGYERNVTVWLPRLSTGDIYTELDRILGTSPNGSRHTKMAGDAKEFDVYGLTVDVLNAPFKPDHSIRDETLAITTRITLEVPLWFMGVQVDVMKADLVIATNFVAKF